MKETNHLRKLAKEKMASHGKNPHTKMDASTAQGQLIHPRMIRRCSYCKEVYGHIDCIPENDGLESHGICQKCYETERHEEPIKEDGK